MKVKKYIAPSMPEAMKKVRQDLGTNAVILQTKEVKRGGFLGLFAKKRIEVVAGLDPNPIRSDESKKETVLGEVEKTISPSVQRDNEVILSELQQLKQMIHLQSSGKLDSELPEYQLAFRHLVDQEVDEAVAIEIINTIIKSNGKEEQITYEAVMEAVGEYIEKRIRSFDLSRLTEKKVIQFIGPTGVGKTTTIAKIAATLMLNNLKKVAFITTDTYRIAAVDQLKTYARILNVPLEVAYSLEEYREAIAKLKDYDVILVDTAGRNFREEKFVDQLEKNSEADTELDTYLVLSLTAKPKDIMDTFDQFHAIPIQAIIFTKIDETTQFGSLINLPLTKGVDIAFLTNGQDVPDDLLIANPKKISQLITGDAK